MTELKPKPSNLQKAFDDKYMKHFGKKGEIIYERANEALEKQVEESNKERKERRQKVHDKLKRKTLDLPHPGLPLRGVKEGKNGCRVNKKL